MSNELRCSFLSLSVYTASSTYLHVRKWRCSLFHGFEWLSYRCTVIFYTDIISIASIGGNSNRPVRQLVSKTTPSLASTIKRITNRVMEHNLHLICINLMSIDGAWPRMCTFPVKLKRAEQLQHEMSKDRFSHSWIFTKIHCFDYTGLWNWIDRICIENLIKIGLEKSNEMPLNAFPTIIFKAIDCMSQPKLRLENIEKWRVHAEEAKNDLDWNPNAAAVRTATSSPSRSKCNFLSITSADAGRLSAVPMRQLLHISICNENKLCADVATNVMKWCCQPCR